MPSETDRIEKKIHLRATRARVWRAISDSAQFGAWFGMRLEGPFKAKTPIRGAIVPTTVDPEIAKLQEPHTGAAVELVVEEIVPERLFSFRWHPFAIDPDVDYSAEPTTLVMFELADDEDGIVLTITESGFDKIPVERRAAAFKANDGGWAAQTRLIEKYLAQHG